MNFCKITEELMPLYAEGLLSQESRAFVEEHIRSCPSCRERLALPDVSCLSGRVEDCQKDETVQKTCRKIRGRLRKTALVILLCAAICVALAAAGMWIFNRWSALYPQGLSPKDDELLEKSSMTELWVESAGTADTIFNGEGCEDLSTVDPDISVGFTLPDGFTQNGNVYLNSETGAFISFHTYACEDYPIPATSAFASQCAALGISGVVDKILYAYRYDLERVTVFSDWSDIQTAAGVRLVRKFADFVSGSEETKTMYVLSGDLKGYIMRGSTGTQDQPIWYAALEEGGNLCFITVKDPEGIGASIDTLAAWLSTVAIK